MTYTHAMGAEKTSSTAGLAGMYLLVIGVVLALLGIVIWGLGGNGLLLFVLGAVALLAWLIIKAAKS